MLLWIKVGENQGVSGEKEVQGNAAEKDFLQFSRRGGRRSSPRPQNRQKLHRLRSRWSSASSQVKARQMSRWAALQPLKEIRRLDSGDIQPPSGGPAKGMEPSECRWATRVGKWSYFARLSQFLWSAPSKRVFARAEGAARIGSGERGGRYLKQNLTAVCCVFFLSQILRHLCLKEKAEAVQPAEQAAFPPAATGKHLTAGGEHLGGLLERQMLRRRPPDSGPVGQLGPRKPAVECAHLAMRGAGPWAQHDGFAVPDPALAPQSRGKGTGRCPNSASSSYGTSAESTRRDLSGQAGP